MKTTTAITTAAIVFCSVQLVVLAPLHAFTSFFTSPSGQYLVINPTTTVTTETSNNTSASNQYTNPGNGNMTPGNISKVPTRSLLYANNQTKLFVHLEPWFCTPHSDHCSCGTGSDGVYRCNGHILTQYNSNDQTQVDKQVNDMISRGIQGTIIDWYGQNHYVENETSKKVRIEAETNSPSTFQFIIMTDGGQYGGCNGNPTCIQNGLISDLTYAATTFVPSPNYAKTSDGRPYMFFFNPESGINWDTVWNAVSQYNYKFIFEWSGGFTHSHTAGAFAWVHPTANPEDTAWSSSLVSFYNTAKTYPNLHTFGAGFKGFDDHLCTWSPPPPNGPRIIDQHNGQVYLKTFTLINNAYSASTPLENLQMVTWNDYDEGSELESGIDNAISITASVNNETGLLSWTVSNDGNPTTLDHFTVFASTNDINLMVLQDNLPVSQTTLNLTTFNLPANTYLRVKAVGKPMIKNHLTAGGVLFAGGGGGGGIQGQILSAIDQHPIQGATVSCSLGQRTTDANGYYVYNNVPPGQYTLTASASGWLPNSATVTVTNSMVNQNIQIATAGKVTGTVTRSGLGYSGAQVTCSGGVIYTQQTYTTNAQGVYASSWIPIGNYSCFASLGLGTMGQLKPMTITAGNTTTLNFQF